MKILFFVNKFPCVSETFVLNQITSMIDKGHDVRIYSWGSHDHNCSHEDINKYGLLSRIIYRELKIPHRHITRFFKIFPIILKLFLKYGSSVLRLSLPRYGHQVASKNLLQYYIAEPFLHLSWQADAIISHFGDTGIYITAMRNAGIISPKVKCFTYFHAHEICRMSVDRTASFYGPMFNEYDMLLPINHRWEKQLIAAGANPQRVKVLRMGIDLNRFKYIENNIIDNTVNILSVGRLCGQKGFEYAIKGVVEYFRTAKKKVSYKIIGGGELEEKLKSLVTELDASDYIQFLGIQPQQVVSEEMEKTNIFLLPSVTDKDGYMEGIPVALMEAMARGLVCISTYHSGIPELIENSVTGFLCNEKDPDGIAHVLRYIERLSTEQFDHIRQKAHCVVDRDFNVVKEMNKLQNLIVDK